MVVAERQKKEKLRRGNRGVKTSQVNKQPSHSPVYIGRLEAGWGRRKYKREAKIGAGARGAFLRVFGQPILTQDVFSFACQIKSEL